MTSGLLLPRRRLLRRGGALLVMTSALVSCSPGADLPPLPDAAEGAYRLGPGDVVRVITFGEAQLSADFRISDNGNISFPLIGNVQANGLSTGELETAIIRQLKQRRLFVDPSVSVEIITYRPVFVLGEVTKPGQYPYQPRMTVLSAVAVAGGFTYRAVEDYASITRTGADGAVEGKVTRQTLVAPGDVITIFERRI
jgi:polysaccharide export outer membrane protein